VIFGILLAAGRGRRIGAPKALLRLDGETFHERLRRAFEGAGLPVVVVVSAEVAMSLPQTHPGEHRKLNPDPDGPSGMFGSIRLGVEAALALQARGLVLLPVDLPLVTAQDMRAIAIGLDRGAKVAVATHEGRRGHPIGVDRAVAEEILAAPRGSTLREIVRLDQNRVVEIPVSRGAIEGVNTREDLERVSGPAFR
jgi:CTP:molybdopterin cytidylyltransferase MocA